MHNPWLQIANEVMDVNAPQLGAELDVSDGDAYLMLSRFIRWAVDRCPEDRPPSASAMVEGRSAARQIAQAMRWTGDPQVMLAALVRLPYPMVEVRENGIRIRGLKRYDRSWSKSHPDAARVWKAANPQTSDDEEDEVPEHGTNPAPNTAPSRRSKVPGKPPPDPDPDPDPELLPPPPLPSSSDASIELDPVVVGKEFWGPIARLRLAAGLDAPTDATDKFNRWAVKLRREGYTPRDGALCHQRYLDDDDFEGKAWPVAIFLSPKVSRSRLPPKAVAPPPPPTSPLRLELERRLGPLREDGHVFAASEIRMLEPVAIADGRLQLRPKDHYAYEWAKDHYAKMIHDHGLELLTPPEGA